MAVGNLAQLSATRDTARYDNT